MKPKFTMILMLFALGVQLVTAQQKTVSGTVSDENGLPLPGATVIRAGTSSGTSTDFDGKYLIKVNLGDVLEISYVGYVTQSLTVDEANTYSLSMIPDNTLDEVIVTGYTSQKKSDLTGSIVTVDQEQIGALLTSTVDQALQGQISGLAITSNSGTPGSTSQVRIRGISSITAGNEPLYVIDGVPINNDNVSSSDGTSFLSSLAGFDGNNIETITILKDASSTSQYGARGANGVILINTKNGKAGKTKFTFSTSYGVQNDAVNGPEPLTAAQRLELHAEASFNDGEYPSKQDAMAALLNSNKYSTWNQEGRPETNWKENVRNGNAPIQITNFSVSGGGNGHTFFGSLGYMNQEGTVIGSSFERISGSINFTKSISENLEFSTKNQASYSYQDAFLERSAYFSGARSSIFFQSPLRRPKNNDGTLNLFGGSLPNPLYLIENDVSDNRFTRVLSNNLLRWNANKKLVLGTRFNVDLQLYNYRTYANKNYGYGVPTNGDASQYFRNNVFYVFQNFLEYKFKINPNHIFDFTLLQEYQSNRYYFLGAAGENFPDDGLENLNSLGKITSANSSVRDKYRASYLGLVNYKLFDSKYVLNLSFRREGSSLFSKKNRWGNFWSVGGAWNIDRESFLASSDIVNNLKLRASYGTTGNSQIKLNKYQALFSYNNTYGGEGSQAVDTYGNENLSWEKNTTLDLGLDFVLVENLFSGSIGYFNRNTSDLLLNVPLSLTSGFSSQVKNIGTVNNKGIEAELLVNIIRNDDVNLSLGGNFSSISNKVTELAKKPDGSERTLSTTTTKIESGHPIREWYMPTWAGVNATNGTEEWYINGVNGAKTSNFNDAARVYQGGNAIPKITAGLNLHFDYKGFFLDASTYYAGGHKIYEGWHRYTNQPNGYTFVFQGLQSLLDRWQKPGDKTRNGKYTTSTTPWQRHSKYLYDGDFIRLRTAQIGYNFKDRFSHFGIDNLKVFIKGNNLLTWVKDKNLNYDPEVDLGDNLDQDGIAGGETGLETPPSKSISFGLTVNF